MKKNCCFLFLIILFISLISVKTYSQTENSGDAAANEEKPQVDKNKETKPDETADEDKWKLLRGVREYNYEYGISPFNPSNFAGPKEYDVYGRHLHLFNFRIGRVIGSKRNVTYQYLFGFTPLSIFTKNEVANPKFVSPTATPNVAPTVRQTTLGFGVQPVNFRFIFFSKKRLKPYAQVGAGILLTERSMPVPRSTPFNFTGDYGGGLMYMLNKNRMITGGYRYFHISNGNIGGKINNPGFNANVFYFGYSILK